MDSIINFIKFGNITKQVKGHILEDGKILINYNPVIHDLIKEAGTKCESYASDIYTIIKRIEAELIDIKKIGHFNYIIGFQKSGIDFIRNAHNRTDNFFVGKVQDYLSIWRIDVTKEKINNEIEVTINYGRVYK